MKKLQISLYDDSSKKHKIYYIQKQIKLMTGQKQFTQSKKKCQQRCQEFTFNIQPRNTSRCWIKQETKIDFCPLYNETLGRYDNIVPAFNHDNQSCLPGFILELDKNDYQQSMHKYKEDHERKIQEYTMKKKELYVPKPGRKHRYCGVCRKPYNDYLEHIKSSEHIRQFNSHDFVRIISTLITDNYQTKKQAEPQLNSDSSTYAPKLNPIVEPPKKRGRKPKNGETSTKKQQKTNKKTQQTNIQQQIQGIPQEQQQIPNLQTPIPQSWKPPMFFYPYFAYPQMFYNFQAQLQTYYPVNFGEEPYKQVRQEISIEDMSKFNQIIIPSSQRRCL